MSSKNLKTLKCRVCGEDVKNVSIEAEQVICWKCVQDSLGTVVTDEEVKEINND